MNPETNTPDAPQINGAGPSIHDSSSPFASPGKLSRNNARSFLPSPRVKTVTAAAGQAGVHSITIQHWLQNEPEFAMAAQRTHAEYEHRLSDELAELSTLALATLKAVLQDPKAS